VLLLLLLPCCWFVVPWYHLQTCESDIRLHALDVMQSKASTPKMPCGAADIVPLWKEFSARVHGGGIN
jgi:hypothetical protein